MVEDYRVQTANAFHTQEELLRLFHYDEETGKLFWRIDKARAKAGEEAKTPHNTGYLSVQVDGISYLVHRVIWCMIYGEFPDSLIDHEDLDRTNNKLSNLRKASGTDNNCNSSMRSDNTSGIKGVSWHKRIGRWQARVQVNGKRTVAYFDDIEEARSHVFELRKSMHREFSNNGA